MNHFSPNRFGKQSNDYARPLMIECKLSWRPPRRKKFNKWRRRSLLVGISDYMIDSFGVSSLGRINGTEDITFCHFFRVIKVITGRGRSARLHIHSAATRKKQFDVQRDYICENLNSSLSSIPERIASLTDRRAVGREIDKVFVLFKPKKTSFENHQVLTLEIVVNSAVKRWENA
ncbi:hypothetical protein BS17DRAFT_769657 [Gyrodon lividus]|nr:hypothetical protein BS17DRAFT_769657 [Gyrodon lividus]